MRVRRIWICLMLMLLAPAVFAAGKGIAAETEEILPGQQMEDFLQESESILMQAGRPEETAGEDEASAQESSTQLPAKYDSRQAGKHPTVKSQGKLGTCWALTATSALEAYFQPKETLVFSADHMSMQNGFVIDQKEGGDYRMIMAYLSGWYGPVLEEEDPYGDGETKEGLEAAVHVKEMRLLEGKSRNAFKEMILQYGCVQSSLYMSRSTTSPDLDYYNEDTFAYRYTKKAKPDHDVLILGWDDSFPREAFRLVPEQDGAWICQNTWGEDFGDGGIFYVSYEDTVMASSGLVYTAAAKSEESERIYQTDTCGWQGRIGYGKEECSFANVFQAEDDEELTGVGFYSLGAHSTYEVYLVHDFEDTGSFWRRRTVARGETSGPGFYSAVIEEPRELRKGERFAVIVSIHTDGATKPVAVEIKKDLFTAGVTLEGKEGYISPYGWEWENVEEGYDANLCLKAYTRIKQKAGS